MVRNNSEARCTSSLSSVIDDHTFQAVVVGKFFHEAVIFFVSVGMRAVRMEKLMGYAVKCETVQEGLERQISTKTLVSGIPLQDASLTHIDIGIAVRRACLGTLTQKIFGMVRDPK